MIILYPLGSGRDPERLTWIRSCVRGGTFFKHPPYWDKPIGTLLNILYFCSLKSIYRGLQNRSIDGCKFKMIVRSRVKTNCFCVVDMNKQNVWVWIFFNNHAKQKKTFAAWRSLLPFVSKQMIKIQKKVSNPISNAQLEVILLLNFTSLTQLLSSNYKIPPDSPWWGQTRTNA